MESFFKKTGSVQSSTHAKEAATLAASRNSFFDKKGSKKDGSSKGAVMKNKKRLRKASSADDNDDNDDDDNDNNEQIAADAESDVVMRGGGEEAKDVTKGQKEEAPPKPIVQDENSDNNNSAEPPAAAGVAAVDQATSSTSSSSSSSSAKSPSPVKAAMAAASPVKETPAAVVVSQRPMPLKSSLSSSEKKKKTPNTPSAAAAAVKAAIKKSTTPAKKKAKLSASSSSSSSSAAARSADADDDDGEKEEEEEDRRAKQQSKADFVDSDSDDDDENLGFVGVGAYHPVDDAGFKLGENVPYALLGRLFAACDATTKRLEIIEACANCLRSVIALKPSQLLETVYLCVNQIAPAYEGLELGVGDTILMKAVADATGSTLAKLKAKVKSIGDLGEVAQSTRGQQRCMFPPPKLTVVGVFKELRKIASLSGSKSGAAKANIIKKLMVSCRDEETKYIIRALQGKMRIGLAELSVVSALGRAVALTPPSATLPPPVLDNAAAMGAEKFAAFCEAQSQFVKQAVIEVPNYEIVIPKLLEHGAAALPQHCFLTPGVPIKVMLGKPAKGVQEVLDRFDGATFTIEFKYDGERAQIHRLKDGTYRVFSRNSENLTDKYPDLLARLHETFVDAEQVESFIIDCEVVAWSVPEQKILPFQTLSTRKRKVADGDEEQTVQVCLFAFDCIYLNGESFIKAALADRRAVLHSTFKPVDGMFSFARHLDTSDADDITEFLNLSIASSCEGLMVKALTVDAQYVPAKRNWIKVKKDYLDGVGDTLDLVVIAAWLGKGKRTGTYGSFLLACYDDDAEEYQSICKVGTGLTDADLEQRTAALKQYLIDAPPTYYQHPESMHPDVWFSPGEVWETLCADLSISPAHKAAAGKVHESRGIALRFPRFIRLRPDKKPEQATTADQVVEFYEAQSVIAS